jgi:hypothetical protein
VVPLGRLHIRPLQFFHQEHWDSASQDWEALVPILPVLLPHLDWWTRRETVLTGVALLHPVPSLTLYTDSSVQRWGAFLEGKSVSGVWSLVQQQENINLLEMRAVLLALQDSSSFESSSASDGQYNSSGLLTESRRNSLSCSLSSLQRNSSSLSSIAHSSGSQTYSRDLQCTGRLSVSLQQSSQHRVGTAASSVRLSCSAVGLSSCRSFCYQSESQTGNLSIYSSRPSGLRSRRHVSLLGRNVRIRLSSIPLSSSSASQDQAIRLQDHTCCTSLAKTSMVSRRDLLSQFKGKVVHPRPESLHLYVWLLSGRDYVRNAFLKEQPHTSQSLSDSLQGSCMRPSGQSSVIGVVDAILIQSESLQQLADFLIYLFEIKQLVPSTIKGYKFSYWQDYFFTWWT